MQDMQETWISNSPEETQDLARTLFKTHKDISLWLLDGNLGAGKTSFVQALVQEAKSPTFAYVKEYPELAHYDLYRLQKPDHQLHELIEEHLEHTKVFIEWPERMQTQWPKPYIRIQLKALKSGKREISLQVVR